MSNTSTSPQTRAITIAILAMGGEGGGVLADWLVDLAEHNGFLAQTTSVPGVAQRTGATIYYLEMFAKHSIPEGSQPVFALSPFPGHVDIVLASELMEAGRALQRGLVNSERTTLITSSHRVYAMTERIAMGDGRMDSDKLMAGAKAAAHQFIAADFSAMSESFGSLIGPALYGALAASGQLPFTRQQFEETIQRGGIGVASSLQAFAAGFEEAQAQLNAGETPAATEPPSKTALKTSVGPRLQALALKIENEFRTAAHDNLLAGIARLTDYQNETYAKLYLDRLASLNQTAPQSELGNEMVAEAARHLALWMSYEDTVRVGRFTKQGRIVKTTSLRGYLLLYFVSELRVTRPYSLRYALEQERISEWLNVIQGLVPTHGALALQVIKAQQLVKGYGDTHSRGWRNFQRLLTALPQFQNEADAANRLQKLQKIALSDDSEQELLTSLKAQGLLQAP